MYLRFPKPLHNIHKFQLDGKYYVVDLDCGRTTVVGEVLWDLLNLCADHDLHGLLAQLSSKYTEWQIFSAIEELERYATKGLLVSPLSTSRLPRREDKEPLKLFVPYDFLEHRERLDALTNFSQYQFLIALARKADVHIAIPSDEPEPNIDFGLEGIHPLVVESEKLHAAVRFVMDGCDGVLLLSQHPQSELAFFRHAQVPIVCRIEADGKSQANLPELALNTHAVLRDSDALCVAASWLQDSLGSILPIAPDRLFTISSGADIENFAPADKLLAKKTVAQMFGWENRLNQPVVGILCGAEPKTTARIASRVAHANPHLSILVLDDLLEKLLPDTADNLHFFGVRSFEERKFLPVIFNALDLLCFATMPGVSASLVLDAMACGIPPVVISKKEDRPTEVGDAGILVKAKGSHFDRFVVDVDALSHAIDGLLADGAEYARHAKAARRAAESHTWDLAARCTLELFKNLNQRRNVHQWAMPAGFPFLFTPYYDRTTDTHTFLAFDMVSQSYRSIEDGLAWTLFSEGHTLSEIEAVLQHICQDVEKVKQIIEELQEYQ